MLGPIDPSLAIASFRDFVPESLLFTVSTILNFEQLIGDITSVVLHKIVLMLIENNSSMSMHVLPLIIVKLLGHVTLSVTLGAAIAGICMLMVSLSEGQSDGCHGYVLFVCCLLPYYLAEALHLSGAVAMLMCLIILNVAYRGRRQYGMLETFHRLSHHVSFISEITISGLLGVSTVSYTYIWSWSTIIICMVALVVSRCVTTYACILRHDDDDFMIKTLIVIGGVRGAVSFCMSVTSPGHRHLFMSTCLMVVLSTMVTVGGIGTRLLTKIKKFSVCLLL